jgi:hypothetical protein
MKRVINGFYRDGKPAVSIEIDGSKVSIWSQDKNLSGLDLDSMKLRCQKNLKGIIADGYKIVKPGDPDYPSAVIDTLESMGLDVVG